ncbi:UNVERIFIED_CONTAM: Transcriptional corepressor SEUSS [Sesamum angustifolium]|uniref:Transcriptional corepressor SEUSS n=1 Tax=Sesamum angustifolium TaxID=2727405 RepID=A0AAW2L504_9LAMI
MMPQGPPTPLGGGQPIPPSLLRSNSGLLGGQGAGMPSQNAFSSLVSPRNQFNNMNMLGNVPNVSSLLHQSFGNGGPGSGLSVPGSSQRGLIDGGAECDPLSNVGTGWDLVILLHLLCLHLLQPTQIHLVKFKGNSNLQTRLAARW